MVRRLMHAVTVVTSVASATLSIMLTGSVAARRDPEQLASWEWR